ncbi:unnamed protein product, partial [Brenthis ino]
MGDRDKGYGVAGPSSLGRRAAGGCVCRHRRAAFDDLPSQGRSYTCHRPLPAAAITNLSPLHHPVLFHPETQKCSQSSILGIAF